MRRSRRAYKAFSLPLFVIVFSILNYSRLTGTENIRAIHIVTLLLIGMGIGVLLVNTINYFRNGSNEKDSISG